MSEKKISGFMPRYGVNGQDIYPVEVKFYPPKDGYGHSAEIIFPVIPPDTKGGVLVIGRGHAENISSVEELVMQLVSYYYFTLNV